MCIHHPLGKSFWRQPLQLKCWNFAMLDWMRKELKYVFLFIFLKIDCTFINIILQLLVPVLEKFPGLEHIDISGNSLGNSGVSSIIKVVRVCYYIIINISILVLFFTYSNNNINSLTKTYGNSTPTSICSMTRWLYYFLNWSKLLPLWLCWVLLKTSWGVKD